LQIAPWPDLDAIDVSAQHAARPDAHALREADPTDDHRRRREVHVGGDLGHVAEVALHDRLRMSTTQLLEVLLEPLEVTGRAGDALDGIGNRPRTHATWRERAPTRPEAQTPLGGGRTSSLGASRLPARPADPAPPPSRRPRTPR